MPVEPRGPRLWFRPGNRLASGRRAAGYWIIKDDGAVRISTGVRSARRGRPPPEAQDALARYILERRGVPRDRNRAADAVEVADVIAIYMQDRAPHQARPVEVIQRCEALLGFWGGKVLSQVTGRTCREYVAFRDGRAVARRELEDLRAAINHHRAEGLSREVVEVTLPDRGPARDRWLTRSEVARLIWAAWRYREIQRGEATGRASRKHVARFLLVAVYTGTRAGAVCGASLGPVAAGGWIDLERGVFYRRGTGEVETKKRKPPVRLPLRLLAHMRRWAKDRVDRDGKTTAGQRYAVEWQGCRIGTGIEKAFRNTCAAAGLKGVTPHVLRHTCATWLMQRGVPVWEAAGYLGMTLETLERIYGHHHPEFQANATSAVVRKA